MENNPKDNKNIEKHKNVAKYVKMFKNKSQYIMTNVLIYFYKS